MQKACLVGSDKVWVRLRDSSMSASTLNSNGVLAARCAPLRSALYGNNCSSASPASCSENSVMLNWHPLSSCSILQGSMQQLSVTLKSDTVFESVFLLKCSLLRLIGI